MQQLYSTIRKIFQKNFPRERMPNLKKNYTRSKTLKLIHSRMRKFKHFPTVLTIFARR